MEGTEDSQSKDTTKLQENRTTEQNQQSQTSISQVDKKELIEAALFMSPNAMSIQDIMNATGISSPGFIEKSLKELMEKYANDETALRIEEINSKYMFSLKEPYASMVSKLAAGPDISKSSLRILAYVSKNNGIMQSEIVKIFGSSAYEHIKELVEKDFIEAKKQGRSKKIVLTQKFKEYFNVQ